MKKIDTLLTQIQSYSVASIFAFDDEVRLLLKQEQASLIDEYHSLGGNADIDKYIIK